MQSHLPPCETFSIKSIKILWQKGQAPYLRLSHAALTYKVSTSTLTAYSSTSSSPDICDAADDDECLEEDGGGEEDEAVDNRSSNVMIFID